jgi:UDP-N-acetylglucosamine--N-acetylmuramyl-(pentapeptide) pyrophosphoryl-undecaprenol N-acetylglucosamine transferase
MKLGPDGRGVIVLAAGGTGGHLFPAQALAEALVQRGYLIHLMSDDRVSQYASRFPALQIHVIPASSLTPGRPWQLAGQLARLWSGYRRARRILVQLKPKAVVGFGGYPSVPPFMAAARLELAVALHEQNAVMGRANRFLAGRARLIASSFPEIANLSARHSGNVVVTGNPVRQAVLDVRQARYAAPAADEVLRLVVFGGSQGARLFSELMPAVVSELSGAVRRKLEIVQQCRPEDLDNVGAAYRKLGVEVELQPFFADMPQRLARSHLVICRSGASTVAELSVIGRPGVLVPLPSALDNDQLRNAEAFAAAGAGWVMREGEFTASDLAAFLTRVKFADGELAKAAAAARNLGRPDAAERLADEIERMINEAQDHEAQPNNAHIGAGDGAAHKTPEKVQK